MTTLDGGNVFISSETGKVDVDVGHANIRANMYAEGVTSFRDHVRSSFDHCLSSLAMFDTSDCLHENEAFIICQSSFLDHVIAKALTGTFTISVKASLLYQTIQDLSPEMADIMLATLVRECKARSIRKARLEDSMNVVSLTRNHLWFRLLCSYDVSPDWFRILCSCNAAEDHKMIPKEILGDFLDALQRSRPSIFDLATEERTEMEKLTSEELTERKKELTRLCKDDSVQRKALDAAKQALEATNEELMILRNDIKMQRAHARAVGEELVLQIQNVTKAIEEKDRAVQEEKRKALCQICMVKLRDTVSLPCSHFLYCYRCLSQRQRRSKKCPSCKGSVTSLVKCVLLL